MIDAYLQGVSIIAPGMPDWACCRDVLLGKREYRSQALAHFSPQFLPANERRRITPTVRLALQAAESAMQSAAVAPGVTAAVFASSHGDLDIADRICMSLTLPERPVSPIDFHNCVHNAPAGYWAIGSNCHLPSTTLSAGVANFSAGLLEAASQSATTECPVLLVVYDLPAPPALAAHLPETSAFAAGVVVSHTRSGHCLAGLRLTLTDHARETALANPLLEALRCRNPAARILPLLETLATETGASCVLPYLDGRGLLVQCTPC